MVWSTNTWRENKFKLLSKLLILFIEEYIDFTGMIIKFSNLKGDQSYTYNWSDYTCYIQNLHYCECLSLSIHSFICLSAIYTCMLPKRFEEEV